MQDDPWKAGTWEGLEEIQREETARWTFRQKLEWLEKACALAHRIQANQKKQSEAVTPPSHPSQPE